MRLWCSLALLLAACGGRPTEELDGANAALAEAKLAKSCAPDEYEAAANMYRKAVEYANEGKNSESRAAAEAARKLAEKAQSNAMIRRGRGDCPTGEPALAEAANATNLAAPAAPPPGPSDLKTVFFDYDAFELSTESRKTLEMNASILKANPDALVTVEGHCDQRGSTEFNLALGEKRATVVRAYLKSLGIDEGQMSLISYGEENPADAGDTEAAHARNRRVQFSVR